MKESSLPPELAWLVEATGQYLYDYDPRGDLERVSRVLWTAPPTSGKETEEPIH